MYLWITLMFISCLDCHSDGTHSLQRIHWWASDAMVHFFKSAQSVQLIYILDGLRASKFSANSFFFLLFLLSQIKHCAAQKEVIYLPLMPPCVYCWGSGSRASSARHRVVLTLHPVLHFTQLQKNTGIYLFTHIYTQNDCKEIDNFPLCLFRMFSVNNIFRFQD